MTRLFAYSTSSWDASNIQQKPHRFLQKIPGPPPHQLTGRKGPTHPRTLHSTGGRVGNRPAADRNLNRNEVLTLINCLQPAQHHHHAMPQLSSSYPKKSLLPHGYVVSPCVSALAPWLNAFSCEVSFST